MRIFFGHQSVGQNIIDGLFEKGPRLRVPVVEWSADAGGPGLVHDRLGHNGSPRSKIDDFVERIESPRGASADLALMKLCYADIGADTDVEGLFAYYRRAVSHLSQAAPDTVVLHVTVPLRRMPTGNRARLRRLLQRPETALEDNRARTLFNNRLTAGYGCDHVFDLARLESTKPGGRRVGRRAANGWVDSLAPAYTNDGGHLNAAGRARLASAFSRFLEAWCTRNGWA